MICEAWEGLTVDGKFPLLERLLGGRGRCIFLTVRQGINTAGIRLVVADSADQDKYLAKWDVARALSHPSLTQVMETGRSSIRGSELAYVVVEKPDAFLSEFIPSKSLSPARAKQILKPIVDALTYVHGKGIAHGSVKPSNIVQVGEQWKLASDEMAGSGEIAGISRDLETYDAPEAGAGALTPAADVWSVGIIAIEAFAQKTPMWDRAAKGNLGVPEFLPAPFHEIARRCLRWEPDERISIKEIGVLLDSSTSLSEVESERIVRAPVEVKSGAFAAPAAPKPMPAAEEKRTDQKGPEEKPAPVPASAEEEGEYEEEYDDEYDEYDEEGTDELTPRSRGLGTLGEERKGIGRVLFTGVLLLVIVAGVMAVRGYWSEFWRSAESRIAPQATQPSPQSQAPAAETESSKSAPSGPDQTAPQNQTQPPLPESQSATPSESSAQNQSPTESQNVPVEPRSAPETQVPSVPPPSPTSENQHATTSAESQQKSAEEVPALKVANARGVVTKRELPNVAAGAREGMRRPIAVEVQVSVNERGAVSDAACLTQGPGNYFARVSVQAAQAWKFRPPVTDGQPRASSWILRFHFDRSHVEVTATEIR